MLVQTTTELRNRHLASAVFEPERFAADFNALAQDSAPAAVSLWTSAVRALPEDLRAVLGRFLVARLGAIAQAQLNQHPEGGGLLFSWKLERSRRPAMPPLPFFSPRLAWFHFADLVAQYGSPAAKGALAQGAALVVLLLRPNELTPPMGLPRQDDQLAVLQGSGAGLAHRHARSFSISSQGELCGTWEGSLLLTHQASPWDAQGAYIGHTGQGTESGASGIHRSICIHGAPAEFSQAPGTTAGQQHALAPRALGEFLATLGTAQQVCCMVLCTR